MMVESTSMTIGVLSSVGSNAPSDVVAGLAANAKTCSSLSKSNAPGALCVAASADPGGRLTLLAVPQTMLSSAVAVPQTMLSATAVPQTMLSDASAVPQTMLSARSTVPHTMLPQSAPPQSVPHTMLSEPSAVPQTMLSALTDVPHTMLSEANAVPQTILSARAVPQTMFWPATVLATPQVVPRSQALAAGVSTPPVSLWLPQMMC